MSDFLDGLERDLVAAARRQAAVSAPKRRPARAGVRSVLLAGGLLVVAAGSAAGGTLLALRGSVIPGPAAIDAGPTLTPVAGSSRVLDPGRPPARLTPQPNRAVALVLPGSVPPQEVRVRIEFTDGRRTDVRGDQNLVPAPSR